MLNSFHQNHPKRTSRVSSYSFLLILVLSANWTWRSIFYYSALTSPLSLYNNYFSLEMAPTSSFLFAKVKYINCSSIILIIIKLTAFTGEWSLASSFWVFFERLWQFLVNYINSQTYNTLGLWDTYTYFQNLQNINVNKLNKLDILQLPIMLIKRDGNIEVSSSELRLFFLRLFLYV